MKIYIVVSGEYEDYKIEGVHTNKRKALDARDRIKESDRPVDIRLSAKVETWLPGLVSPIAVDD